MSLFLAAPGPAEASKAVDTILGQGVLGAICVLLIIAVVFLARALMKSNKDRITDLTTYANKIKEGNEAMYDLVIETNKATAHTASEVLLSNREVASKVGSLDTNIQQMNQTLGALKDQQVRLEVGLSRGGQ